MSMDANHTTDNILLFNGSRLLWLLGTLFTLLGTLSFTYFIYTHDTNFQLVFFTLLASALCIILQFLTAIGVIKENKEISFITGYLLSLLLLIIAWRLSALTGALWAQLFWASSFALKLLRFLITLYLDIKINKKNHLVFISNNSKFEWQLLFIRLFIGLDLIPHFCEKLFAGPIIRNSDVQAFTQLGFDHHALLIVYIAGLVELAGCFSISCGFFTRLGSICLCLYLMIATIAGHHFSLGFIWASPGGGWEYPVLWSALILSFAAFGSNGFSLDFIIKKYTQPPRWIVWLMG